MNEQYVNTVRLLLAIAPAVFQSPRYERMSAAQKRSTLNIGWEWQSFIGRGQLLIHTHKALPIKVSILTYERALAIANTLCWSAEARGFTVDLSKDNGRIVVSGHGGEMELRLAEKLDKEIVREKRWSENHLFIAGEVASEAAGEGSLRGAKLPQAAIRVLRRS